VISSRVKDPHNPTTGPFLCKFGLHENSAASPPHGFFSTGIRIEFPGTSWVPEYFWTRKKFHGWTFGTPPAPPRPLGTKLIPGPHCPCPWALSHHTASVGIFFLRAVKPTGLWRPSRKRGGPPRTPQRSWGPPASTNSPMKAPRPPICPESPKSPMEFFCGTPRNDIPARPPELEVSPRHRWGIPTRPVRPSSRTRWGLGPW